MNEKYRLVGPYETPEIYETLEIDETHEIRKILGYTNVRVMLKNLQF